jgi:tRNA 2-thiouridine synthesizing protein E
MPYLMVNNRQIAVDDDGFLLDPGCWDEDVLLALAESDGIAEVGEGHRRVIAYLRDYHKKYRSSPIIRKLCKETGFTIIELYNLFPAGPVYGAHKLAGLPKPSGCV